VAADPTTSARSRSTVAFVVGSRTSGACSAAIRWKQLHYRRRRGGGLYRARVWADPLLPERPVDWIDAEKALR